jgi:dihydrodipicolinate synthase/N-acetylneuraminate lyase
MSEKTGSEIAAIARAVVDAVAGIIAKANRIIRARKEPDTRSDILVIAGNDATAMRFYQAGLTQGLRGPASLNPTKTTVLTEPFAAVMITAARHHVGL